MGNVVPSSFCPPHESAGSKSDNGECPSKSANGHCGDLPPAGGMKRVSSAPFLHQNMIRQMKNRDPFRYYEVISVLGVGSMGSVSKVKKRDEVVGGSARAHNVSTHLDCVPPFFGDLFRSCSGKTRRTDSTMSLTVTDSGRSVGSSSQGNASGSMHKSRGGGVFSRRQDALDTIASSGHGHIHGDSNYEIYFALKSIHLNRVRDETYINELKNEIAILTDLDHPHIVRPMEVFEHRNQIFFTMELCSGGDLYSRDPYTEDDAARIIGAILSAVAYMHSKNIIHRDLKYENVMFVNKSPRSEIKIIDFGLSKKKFLGDEFLKDGVGTIYTMSPEVIKGEYTSQADVWSVGVLLFMTLSSQMPFYGKKRRHVVDKIMKCNYEFRGRRWMRVSKQAKDLVRQLLQVDPHSRPTAEEAMHSEWLSATCRRTEHVADVETMDNIQASLESFTGYGKLKQLALMVIAHRSTSEEIGFLRKAFQKYDIERKGAISKTEFKDALFHYGYTDDELEEMFQGCDIDGTGLIRYTEFLAATIEAHGAINEEKIAESFDRLDSDDSGYISTKNLREILGKEFPIQDIDGIIDEVDLNKDGRISYEEFLCLFDQQQEERRAAAIRLVTARRMRNSMNTMSEISLSGRSDRSMESSVDSDGYLSAQMFSASPSASEGGNTKDRP